MSKAIQRPLRGPLHKRVNGELVPNDGAESAPATDSVREEAREEDLEDESQGFDFGDDH